MERGAYRTFQAETIAHKQAEQEQEEKEEEEANNPMLVRDTVVHGSSMTTICL